MNHEFLMQITADMPCKTIEVNGKPYLSRYFAGKSVTGGQWWLHRFHSADGERHLHSHPWSGTSVILCGGYVEQVRMVDPEWTKTRYWHPGMVNRITPSTVHRIAEVMPDTWTLLYIEPGRLPTWRFIDDNGGEQVVEASPEDWYLSFQPRVAA